MLRILSSMVIILSICFSGTAFAIDQGKIRFRQAIYKGYEGIGLRYPEGVACNEEYVLVADTGNDRLVKYPYQDGVVKDAEFEIPLNSPAIAHINSKGEIFALDLDRRIQIFGSDGTPKESLSPENSPVSRKKMVPRSFTIDQNDNIYILDIYEEVVLVLDSGSGYIRHIPFPENFGFLSDLAVDNRGAIFLVDSVKAAIFKAEPEAEEFVQLTQGLKEYVNFPTYLSLDSQGIMYLVDKHGGNLVLLNRDGEFLRHKFAYGWLESQLHYPAQLCISEVGGAIFIADRSNSRVQMFSAEE